MNRPRRQDTLLRQRAKSVGWLLATTPGDGLGKPGGFMLVDARLNRVVAGPKFELTAEEVDQHIRAAVSARLAGSDAGPSRPAPAAG